MTPAEFENYSSGQQSGGKSSGKSGGMSVNDFNNYGAPSSPPPKYSSLARDDATFQVANPFGTNLDTGIPIGANTANFLSGMGKSFTDLARRGGQAIGVISPADIDEAKRRDAELMGTKAGFVGNVAGTAAAAAPAMLIPGANTAIGATLIGAGMGALEPTGTNDSTLNNTLSGAALGLGGRLVGQGLNKVASAATDKIGAISAKVSAKAAEQAASETASARSAAGNAAQNAYRQLEHLRELDAMRGLNPAEAQIAQQLTAELSQKAQEKLVPAAALKASTAQAYQDAIASEANRASDLAAQKLSGTEIQNQFMARLKRYGPAAAGGILGNMIFPGLGGSVGGAASGLVLRPAIRSMARLATNPAVQTRMLSPISKNAFLNNPNLGQGLSMLLPSIHTSEQ